MHCMNCGMPKDTTRDKVWQWAAKKSSPVATCLKASVSYLVSRKFHFFPNSVERVSSQSQSLLVNQYCPSGFWLFYFMGHTIVCTINHSCGLWFIYFLHSNLKPTRQFLIIYLSFKNHCLQSDHTHHQWWSTIRNVMLLKKCELLLLKEIFTIAEYFVAAATSVNFTTYKF